MAIIKWLADPVNLTAISTVVIALFTIILAIVGYCQARLTRDTIRLARDEFNATHRPEIIVRNVGYVADPEDNRMRLIARIVIVNKGASRAHIINLSGIILTPTDELTADVALRAYPIGKEQDLVGGQPYQWDIESPNHQEPAIRIAQTRGEKSEWICIGLIRYADMEGRIRETGFFRRFDVKSRSWKREENEDYEYSY
jgi:hypothetical protein